MCALMVFAALSLSNDASGGPAGAGSPPAGITEFPRTLTPAETQAVRASNDFGLRLLGRLYAERRDRRANVFISPLSASMSTGAAFATSGNPVLQADRPFLFAIRERLYGMILLVGTVTDPTTA